MKQFNMSFGRNYLHLDQEQKKQTDMVQRDHVPMIKACAPGPASSGREALLQDAAGKPGWLGPKHLLLGGEADPKMSPAWSS